MSIRLGARRLHEGRVALVAPVVSISIIRPAAHSKRGIERRRSARPGTTRHPPDRAADRRARHDANAAHHDLDTPCLLDGDEQAGQRSDGDTGEKDGLAHLGTHWLPSVASGTAKAISLGYFSRVAGEPPCNAAIPLGVGELSKLTYETKATSVALLTMHGKFAMTKARAAARMDRPLVTPTEARRFDKAVTVRDRGAFLFELDRLVREKLAAAGDTASGTTPLTETLRRKAESLRAATPWASSAADVQRGRAEMLREFDRPQNLPLTDFVRLAHKSRQQIYKDIAARRLLALDVGRRGQRIPDWQLTPPGLQLTRAVLQASGDLDAWTIYRALAEPSEALGGQAPAVSVNRGNVDATTRLVLASLGVQDAERGGADA